MCVCLVGRWGGTARPTDWTTAGRHACLCRNFTVFYHTADLQSMTLGPPTVLGADTNNKLLWMYLWTVSWRSAIRRCKLPAAPSAVMVMHHNSWPRAVFPHIIGPEPLRGPTLVPIKCQNKLSLNPKWQEILIACPDSVTQNELAGKKKELSPFTHQSGGKRGNSRQIRGRRMSYDSPLILEKFTAIQWLTLGVIVSYQRLLQQSSQHAAPLVPKRLCTTNSGFFSLYLRWWASERWSEWQRPLTFSMWQTLRLLYRCWTRWVGVSGPNLISSVMETQTESQNRMWVNR